MKTKGKFGIAGPLLTIGIGILAFEYPQIAEIALLSGELFGAQVIPPGGTFSDLGSLAQQGGMLGSFAKGLLVIGVGMVVWKGAERFR
jgi:hypothetical protein